MQDVTLQSFEPHVGSTFQIMWEGKPVIELVLAEAVTLVEGEPVQGVGLRAEPFSLGFLGPLQPIALQAIHELSHPQLGTMSIFLVPNGPDKATRQKMQYQAVFN